MSAQDFPEVVRFGGDLEHRPPTSPVPLKREGGSVTTPTYQYLGPHSTSPSRRERPLRRSSKASLLTGIAVFLICVVIAASVGPTVARSTCNSRVAQATANVQDSTCPPAAVASAITNVAIPSTGCNDTSTFQATYTTRLGQTFAKSCNHNFQGYGIVASIVDSWELCMESCSIYSSYQRGVSNTTGTPQCKGVTYVPSWIVVDWAVANFSGLTANCFLKYNVTSLIEAPNQYPFEIVVSTL